ncbi:MAG: S-layer homology domain-containing protein [Firmicutes bacterium]|nr:S-layer homology domain-containing protein [Bacillota bacterium]
MKRRLLSLAIAAMVLLLSAQSILASETVSLHNISSKHPSDAVTISGSSTWDEVTVKVMRPNQSILYINVLTGENFSDTFTLPADTQLGTYTVVAGQGSSTAVTTFEVRRKSTGGGTSSRRKKKPAEKPPKIEGEQADISQNAEVKKQRQADGTVSVRASVSIEAVEKALAHQQVESIVIDLQEDAEDVVISLPAEAMEAMGEEETKLILKIDDVTLEIPAEIIHGAELASALGVDEEEMDILIKVSELAEKEADKLRAKATQTAKSLRPIGKVLTFSIEAAGKGKTVKVEDFGELTVKGEIPYRSQDIKGIEDLQKLNVYKYNETTEKWEYRRSKGDTENKKVIFYTQDFSNYTIMENNKTFADIRNHWARENIELMAAKHVVNGMNEDTFAPEEKVTRAQFATMLVNALGITNREAGTSFSDVKAGGWYYESVMAAAEAGLVTGVGGGRFAPDANITREQMAVMIMRAYGYSTGEDYEEISDPAGGFKDRDEISGWAEQAVNAANHLGIVTGVTADRFAPADEATRAQAAVMINRLLESNE